MERQITPPGADESRLPTVTTPSSSLAMFDVNKFLKKTFSDYDLGRRHNEQDSSDQQHGQLRSEHFDKNIDGHDQHRKAQRRAGSVPITTVHRIIGQGESIQRSEADDSIVDDQEKHHVDDRVASNRRGRRRDRDEKYVRYSCAYCGQEVVGRSSTNAVHNLYCSSCTSFFIRHSPSEIQRRIAYDEMTQPSAVSSPATVANVGTSSGTTDNKETAPLLCGTNLNKVSLVANDNDDGEDENGQSLQKGNGQQSRREEMEENFRQHYDRNDRRLGRGHVARLQVKARQAPLLPYRQQQSQIRPGQRDDSLTKTNLFGESAPVVVWSKDAHGNNGGSRRSSCTSASSLNRPTCRICHLYGEPGDTLVSPCRCAGTMQYVHTSCLVVS